MIKSIAICIAIAATMLSNCLAEDSATLMNEMKLLNTQIEDAEHVLKTMEEEARQADPLLTKLENEVALAKKRMGGTGKSDFTKFLHDPKHRKERRLRYGQLKTGYQHLLLVDVLKNKTEPMLTCFTCNDMLMSMYAKNIAQTMVITLDTVNNDTPAKLWKDFATKAIAKRAELEEYLVIIEEKSGFPPDILKAVEKRSGDEFVILPYSSYLSVMTPKPLKKQRGDVNKLKKRRANLDIEIKKANK